MHTPFVYIPLKGVHSKSNNRVLDLLKDLNLMCRMLDGGNILKSLIEDSINWDEVDSKMLLQKDISSKFLFDAL